MKIQIPTGRALAALEVLKKLQADNNKDAYRIGRVLYRLEAHPDLTAAEQSRMNLVRKFGDEKDGQFSVPAEKQAAFFTEYAAIANETIEIDVPMMPISVLDSAPVMKPGEAALLEAFIEE